MTKRFDNVADNGVEKALRRGFTVPKGAVNLSWVKAPALSPVNNVVMIDTSKVVAENQSTNSKSKKIAYANALGVLEDENGNEIWDEEYPVISDLFQISDDEIKASDYSDDQILPFLHVSRYFHQDYVGLSVGSLALFTDQSVKVVDKNGNDHIDESGKKRYKVFVVLPTNVTIARSSDSTAYRVNVFLDMIPDVDELYLTYDKVELSSTGVIKNYETDYKERINPRSYFKYVPEEIEVIDRSNANKKIYTSAPSNIKHQTLGLPTQDTYGWKYYTPRKAIPDPRIFQLFRWRLACEFTQPIIASTRMTGDTNQTFQAPDGGEALVAPAVIRAGVVIPPSGSHLSTRANFFFYQMNESEFNIAGLQFVNPIKNPTLNWNRTEQQTASYWHVDLENISLDDLSKFDVLIWAPNGNDSNDSWTPLIPKIKYFTENVGGTFIYETSSLTSFSNAITGVTYTTAQSSNRNTQSSASTYATTLRLRDNTPTNLTDTFSTFGMWKSWPPNVTDIINNYNDVGQILATADVIAGWSLTSSELTNLSGVDIASTQFQYMSAYDTSYTVVAEANLTGTPNSSTAKPVLLHKKTNAGGNIFVSTACLFEDHLVNTTGVVAANTMTVKKFTDLNQSVQLNFKAMVSSPPVAGEMKLRFNVMLFATINKPSPVEYNNGPINHGNQQSTTIYTDWASSWVINGDAGILSDKEKTDYNFVMLPTSPLDSDPVWQRVLDKRNLKQMIQDKIKQLDPDGTNSTYNTFEGASKRYFMIVTNPTVQVLTSQELQEASPPTAWTTAYSPKFEIPFHLGSYVIRDEMISGGIGMGEGKRIYPPKAYDLQSSVSYFNNSTKSSITTNVSITGTARVYYKAPDRIETRAIWVPPTLPTTETHSVWVPPTDGKTVDVVMHWVPDGTGVRIGPLGHQGNYQRNYGIDIWSDVNYDIQNVTCFGYFGLHGVLSVFGGNGLLTNIVQAYLNQEIFFNGIPGPYLVEDGIFGLVTRDKVLQLQQVRGARYQDGVVDAEFWSLMGYALMGFTFIPTWTSTAPQGLIDLALKARSMMDWVNISDDNAGSVLQKVSKEFQGPSFISDGFLIHFNEALPIYKVSILPWTAGTATNDVVVDYLDVCMNVENMFRGYLFDRGYPGNLTGLHGADSQWIDINIPDTVANTVIFRMTQTGEAGWGTARSIGIRDVAVYAKRYMAGSAGYWQNETFTVPGASGFYQTSEVIIPGETLEKTVNFNYSTTLTFDTGVPKTLSSSLGLAQVGSEFPTGSTLAFIRWNPSVTFGTESSSFTTVVNDDNTGTNSLTITYGGFLNSLTSENYVAGPRIGNGSSTFWTKTEQGVLDPYSRSAGWITKDNGLKLICASDGTPYGFPAALPNQATTSMHFARYRLSAFNSDQTVYYGFYDALRKEFVTNSYGEPDISYYDYIRRGPQNIFIAVKTTYEVDTTVNIPGTTDTVQRPFKWAMPVYGVTTGLKPKIQIEPLSSDLGVQDLWSIPVRTGSFTRKIPLRNKSAGSYTNFLKDYQGSRISAYYNIPEAAINAWSDLYGRPYVDVRDEIPIVIDDDTIQVRQYPILMNQVPTIKSTDADPWYPVFKVYTRASLSDQWVEVPFHNVRDYDVIHGTIQLNTSLPSNDPRLVKVDYTSERKVFDLKFDGVNQINLNPYTNMKPEWIDKPLYLYILPAYILDALGNIITASIHSRTLRISDTATIFNDQQPDYMPEAVLLGVVYVSSAFDINDLIMLDTRRRGGGVSTDFEDEEALKQQSEFESYWDVIPSKAVSYQNGGFVIIRLPSSLKEDFTDEQIDLAIERSITAGVRYQIEDLQGNKWSK